MIPRSILLSIVFVAIIYFAINLSMIGVVPWREFVPAAAHPSSKFIVSVFMEKIYGRTAATFFTAAILWTAFGSVFALLLGYSRIPYAAANDGYFFKAFGRLHPTKALPVRLAARRGRGLDRLQLLLARHGDRRAHHDADPGAVHRPDWRAHAAAAAQAADAQAPTGCGSIPCPASWRWRDGSSSSRRRTCRSSCSGSGRCSSASLRSGLVLAQKRVAFLTRSIDERFVACVLGCLAVAAVGAAARAPRVAAQRIVYIGTYTGETSKGIYAFRFDDGSGELTPIGLVAETPSPSFLIASADGRFVYAVNELQTFGGAASGSVTAFAVDSNDRQADRAQRAADGGHRAVSSGARLDRRYLAVANYGGGNFAILPVGTDGRLQKAVTVVTGQNAETGTAKPLGHMVAFDATNKFLITADKGLNRMLVFHFDATTGKVTPNTPPSAPLPPGSGPRHFAMHTNGEWLFTIAEQAATITTFKWDGKAGSLTATSSVPTRPAEVTSGSTAEIALHPNGKFVYGSNRGHDSIACSALALRAR